MSLEDSDEDEDYVPDFTEEEKYIKKNKRGDEKKYRGVKVSKRIKSIFKEMNSKDYYMKIKNG